MCLEMRLRTRLGPGWDQGQPCTLSIPQAAQDWPGMGVSVMAHILQPLRTDGCGDYSRLFEKSFLLLPSPTENPIESLALYRAFLRPQWTQEGRATA